MPSIVCEEVVFIVTTGVGPVVLAFFIIYILPAQAVASGKVTVEALAPVKTNVWSVEAAEVLAANERKAGENDPLTSKVELGDTVPIPTCAFDQIAVMASRKNSISLFIGCRIKNLEFIIIKTGNNYNIYYCYSLNLIYSKYS